MSAMVRYCVCGHSFSNHDKGLDCMVGWDPIGAEDDPEECDCTEFQFDFEEDQSW